MPPTPVAAVRRAVGPPSRWLTLGEQRAVMELGAFVAASPLLRLLGRGDRHPVLVLPGFTADDRSTGPLRWFLRSQGYWAHGWNLGANLGPTAHVVDGLRARLAELHDRHQRAVSLVGWSLGGVYARALARGHPEQVRQVITLGSPFRAKAGDRSAVQALWNARQRSFADEFLSMLELDEDDRPPITVPTTAIYSRSDGIVKWHLCIDGHGDHRENVEVRGSHNGLGVNPSVLYVVADRLAQREGTWHPFRAPPFSFYVYPPPTVHN